MGETFYGHQAEYLTLFDGSIVSYCKVEEHSRCFFQLGRLFPDVAKIRQAIYLPSWRRGGEGGKNRGSEEGGYPLGNRGGIYVEKGELYGVSLEDAMTGCF